MTQMSYWRLVIYVCLAIGPCLAALGPAQTAVAGRAAPLRITTVSLDSKTFDPAKGQKVELAFEINKRAGVVVSIYDRMGAKVWADRKGELEAGEHKVVWDGCRSDGKMAADRVFLYVIEAIGGEEKVVYNPSGPTGGLWVKPHEYTLDKKTGKIEYVLPKACMVRLRAGLKDGLMAATVLDWAPRRAGRHTEKWDGKDPSGLMNLINHPDLALELACYTLPSNTIIRTGKDVPVEPNRPVLDRSARRKLWATDKKYLHYRHNPRDCHDTRFSVSFPKRVGLDEEGNPIVSGTTPLRIELDRRDADSITNSRFEILLYVDGVFFFEIEEGTNPFTFQWNTETFAKGPHIITANLRSYDDHVGVVTRKVVVGAK